MSCSHRQRESREEFLDLQSLEPPVLKPVFNGWRRFVNSPIGKLLVLYVLFLLVNKFGILNVPHKQLFMLVAVVVGILVFMRRF